MPQGATISSDTGPCGAARRSKRILVRHRSGCVLEVNGGIVDGFTAKVDRVENNRGVATPWRPGRGGSKPPRSACVAGGAHLGSERRTKRRRRRGHSTQGERFVASTASRSRISCCASQAARRRRAGAIARGPAQPARRHRADVVPADGAARADGPALGRGRGAPLARRLRRGGLVHVQRTVARGGRIEPTKTGTSWTIPLRGPLSDLLRRQRALSYVGRTESWVFPNRAA
jgi:hypothetical protein